MDTFCILQNSRLLTGHGLPPCWPAVRFDHGRSHRHHWHSRQSWCHFNSKRWIWQLLNHLIWLTSIKWPQEKLLTFLTWICCHHLGHGHFQGVFQRQKIILFTDHKHLENMGHLHTKTRNKLPAALLEHDFWSDTKRCLHTSWLLIKALIDQPKYHGIHEWHFWPFPNGPHWPAKSRLQTSTHEPFPD